MWHEPPHSSKLFSSLEKIVPLQNLLPAHTRSSSQQLYVSLQWSDVTENLHARLAGMMWYSNAYLVRCTELTPFLPCRCMPAPPGSVMFVSSISLHCSFVPLTCTTVGILAHCASKKLGCVGGKGLQWRASLIHLQLRSCHSFPVPSALVDILFVSFSYCQAPSPSLSGS